MILNGIPISPGSARGQASVVVSRLPFHAALAIHLTLSASEEIERLTAARGRAIAQLQSVQRQLVMHGRSDDATIFATHSSLLADRSFTKQMESKISDEQLSAEAAVAQVVLEQERQFLSSSSSLLQDKAADILDIGQRLLRCLRGLPEFESVKQRVLVATSLTPSELVRAAHEGAIAVITESCGKKSHTAILARGVGLPLVTGISSCVKLISNDDDLFVDGTSGIVAVNPDPEEQSRSNSLVGSIPLTDLDGFVQAEPITIDGVRVAILLNISDIREAQTVRQLGADGVGLYRTEFFYLNCTRWPSEQESYDQYLAIASAIGDGELNIRLADFGAEKCPNYADIPLSRNPSLGMRGVRLLLERDDILKTQLKSLERISYQRPLTVLIPMVDTVDTLQVIIDRVCCHCNCRTREDLPFRLGMMVEVPSAAIQIEEMIEHVDAVSIGLNDLTQYLLAADRDDEFMESYHDALQPAVLRSVKRVIEVSGEWQKPVTVCGELAGDPVIASVLVGLGARRFSVSRSDYVRVATHIQQLNVSHQLEIAQRAASCSTRREISQLLSMSAGDSSEFRPT